MSLQDRFRIDELSKVGSKSVTRDESGNISVRRINNKEVQSNEKVEKPFGSEPIRGKQIVPRLKTDTINPESTTNPEQESFSGETTAYAERPIYNEEELQKAVDLKVDELIKQRKLRKGEFVTKEKYDTQVRRVADLTEQLRLQTLARQQAESQIPGLQSTISSLESQLQSLQEELQKKDEAARQLLESFQRVIGDLQTAVINGTKEGVERASLAARVQGLGAQRDTLVQAVQAQNETIKTLRDNIESQREAFQGLLESQRAQTAALQATQNSIQTIASDANNVISGLRNDLDVTNNQLRLQEEEREKQNKNIFKRFGALLFGTK
jgi:chromosome segregation ATPase